MKIIKGVIEMCSLTTKESEILKEFGILEAQLKFWISDLIEIQTRFNIALFIWNVAHKFSMQKKNGKIADGAQIISILILHRENACPLMTYEEELDYLRLLLKNAEGRDNYEGRFRWIEFWEILNKIYFELEIESKRGEGND